MTGIATQQQTMTIRELRKRVDAMLAAEPPEFVARYIEGFCLAGSIGNAGGRVTTEPTHTRACRGEKRTTATDADPPSDPECRNWVGDVREWLVDLIEDRVDADMRWHRMVFSLTYQNSDAFDRDWEAEVGPMLRAKVEARLEDFAEDVIALIQSDPAELHEAREQYLRERQSRSRSNEEKWGQNLLPSTAC